jgi:parallel beta-helix repeat protein
VADRTFSGDLSCPAGHGLIVKGDGITIDGAGFKISGTGTASCGWATETDPSQGDCGIYNHGYDNVVIKHLELEGFCTGIALHGTGQNPDENNVIENCNIHHNGNSSTDGKTHGIHACFMSGCAISNNDVHHNTGTGDGCGDGGNGIFIYAGSETYADNVITKNELHDNRKGGFFTKMKLQHAEITENHAYRNGQGGIILRCKKSNHNLIENNNASGNYGDGIFVGGSSNIIRNNIVENNIAGFKISSTDVVGDGDGIDMGRSDGSFNNELYGNTVCGNEGTDIDTFGPDPGTIGENNTCDTTMYYNDDGTTGCSYSCINAEELAKELSSQGWVMYGTNRCSWCIKQKEEFGGEAFKHINYVNCDENRQACMNASIKAIPCWVSPNGTHYPGYHNLTRLLELASEYQAVQQAPSMAVQPTPSESTPTSSPASTNGFELIFAATAMLTVFLMRRIRGRKK